MSHRPYDVHLSRPLVKALSWLAEHGEAPRRQIARAAAAENPDVYETVYGTFSTLRAWHFVRKPLNGKGKPRNGWWSVTGAGSDFLTCEYEVPITLTILDREPLPPADGVRMVYASELLNQITHPHPASDLWDREAHDAGLQPDA